MKVSVTIDEGKYNHTISLEHPSSLQWGSERIREVVREAVEYALDFDEGWNKTFTVVIKAEDSFA